MCIHITLLYVFVFVFVCVCVFVFVWTRLLQRHFNGAAVCGDVGFSRPNKKQQNSNANGFIVAGVEFPNISQNSVSATATTTSTLSTGVCCTEQSFLGWLLLVALLANIHTYRHIHMHQLFARVCLFVFVGFVLLFVDFVWVWCLSFYDKLIQI